MEVKDGKVYFSEEELRQKKVLLLDQDHVAVHRGKCPRCSATVEFTEAKTVEVNLPIGLLVPPCDEDGIAIGRCDRCNELFSVRVLNPDHCYFRAGAVKTDYALEPIDEKWNELPCINARVDVEDRVGQRDYTYEFSSHPLYVCDSCSCELDALAFCALAAKHQAIAKAHANYVNWSLGKGHGPTPEDSIVRIGLACTCGRPLVAFFHTAYREKPLPSSESLALINIIGSRPLPQRIPVAVYTKDEVISWLHKLLPRWTLAFNEVYVITPFFGHSFQSKQKKVESWLDVVNRLDHRKARIITRSGQLKDFRQAFEEVKGQPYSTLAEHDLGSDIINETKQKNNFHAKIYCAVGNGRCEVFTGSANIVKGPSKEVMHFAQIESELMFRTAFLEPLGVPPIVKATATRRYAIFLDGSMGIDKLSSAGHVKESQYWDLVMNDRVGDE